MHVLMEKDGHYTADEIRDLVTLATNSAIQATVNMVGDTNRRLTKQNDDISEIKESLGKLFETIKSQHQHFEFFAKRCEPVIIAFENKNTALNFLIGKGGMWTRFFVGLAAIITGVLLAFQYILKPLIVNLFK